MTGATITLKGMLAGQPTLFSKLQAPASLDPELLLNRILMRCNNLEPVYPDGPYMEEAIGWWSKSRLEVWELLEETRHYDYTPIHNYDRHETEQTVRDGKYKDDTTAEHSHTTDITGKTVGNVQTEGSNTQDDTNTTTVGGFNTNTSNAPFDRQVLDRDLTNKNTEDSTIDNTNKEENTAQDTETVNRKEDWQDDRELYAYGNIGVTSTQELIQQQRDVVMFNLYDVICEEFVEEFMLLVY